MQSYFETAHLPFFIIIFDDLIHSIGKEAHKSGREQVNEIHDHLESLDYVEGFEKCGAMVDIFIAWVYEDCIVREH